MRYNTSVVLSYIYLWEGATTAPFWATHGKFVGLRYEVLKSVVSLYIVYVIVQKGQLLPPT